MKKFLSALTLCLGICSVSSASFAEHCDGLPEGYGEIRQINITTDNQTSDVRWFDVFDLANVAGTSLRYMVPGGGYQTDTFYQLECVNRGVVTMGGDYWGTFEYIERFYSLLVVYVNRLESGPGFAQVGPTVCYLPYYFPWSGTATLKITYSPKVMYGQFGTCTAIFSAPGATSASSPSAPSAPSAPSRRTGTIGF